MLFYFSMGRICMPGTYALLNPAAFNCTKSIEALPAIGGK